MFADPYCGYYAPLTKIKTFAGSNYTGDRPGPKGCFIMSYNYSQGFFYFADVRYCLAENMSNVRYAIRRFPKMNSKYNKSKSDA